MPRPTDTSLGLLAGSRSGYGDGYSRFISTVLPFNPDDWGAKGDNVTDDSNAVQEAFVQAALNPGARIRFTPGRTYLLTRAIALTAATDITIEAFGATVRQATADAEILRFNGCAGVTVCGGKWRGPSAVVAYTDVDKGALYFPRNVATPCSDVRIVDAEIYDAGCAIGCFSVDRLWVQHCYIHDYLSYGIQGRARYFNICNNRIFNCRQVGGVVAYGITMNGDAVGGFTLEQCIIGFNEIDTVPSWDGIGSHDVEDLLVIGNVIKNVRTGIDLGHLVATNVVRRLVITGNKIRQTTTDTWGGAAASLGGILIVGFSAAARVGSVVITDNLISNFFNIAGAPVAGGQVPGAIGVMHADSVTIVGNVCDEMGAAPANSSGVRVDGTVNRLTIIGNVLQGDMVTGGIRFAALTASQVTIVGNTITQTTGGNEAILISGASTITAITQEGNATNSTVPYSNTSSGTLTPSAVGVRSPAALGAGNNNDYAPQDATTLRLTSNGAGSVLTGMAGGVAGRKVRVLHIGGLTLTVNHQDAASAAANRIITPDGAAKALTVDGTADFEYDATTQRWRLVNWQL